MVSTLGTLMTGPSPQQSMLPGGDWWPSTSGLSRSGRSSSDQIAQACQEPPLIWEYSPAGGYSWPRTLLPQQMAAPSALMAQLWRLPASTSLKPPPEAVESGTRLWPYESEPQQTMSSPLVRAQVWAPPALTLA